MSGGRLALEVVQAENLAHFPMFRHGFFGRRGGVSAGLYESLNVNPASADDPLLVLENRKRVAAELGARAGHLLTCQQVHGDRVVTVRTPWEIKDRPEADAMVTDFGGLALGILTADCAPVLFADNKAGVIGAAHAGWKGAVGGVLEKTVAAMVSLGARPHDIHAAVGPCIWQDSYEVGQEFLAPFLAESRNNQDFFRASHKIGAFYFDLPAYVASKLLAMGVGSVAPSMADTCAQEARFFSYRRSTIRGEAETGRQVSAVMIVD